MKIYITCSTDDKFANVHQKTVDAEQVFIRGFSHYRFFVHINKHTSIFSSHAGKKYVVTEYSTGLIVDGGDTKEEAVKNTGRLLRKKGRDVVDKQIKKQQRKINKILTNK